MKEDTIYISTAHDLHRLGHERGLTCYRSGITDYDLHRIFGDSIMCRVARRKRHCQRLRSGTEECALSRAVDEGTGCVRSCVQLRRAQWRAAEDRPKYCRCRRYWGHRVGVRSSRGGRGDKGLGRSVGVPQYLGGLRRNTRFVVVLCSAAGKTE